MNPFLESTVATPLAEDNLKRYWNRSQLLINTQKETSTPSLASKKKTASSSCLIQSSKRKPLRSKLAVLWVSTSLGLGMVSGWLSQPVIVAGGAAVISFLLPAGIAYALDINLASIDELQKIKGIGPKTAALIVEERDRAGSFTSLADLSERVKGIGPKKVATLAEQGLEIGPPTSTAAKNLSPKIR